VEVELAHDESPDHTRRRRPVSRRQAAAVDAHPSRR
jgi:hypothetical protein